MSEARKTMTDHTNSVEFEAENENKTATPDAPAPHYAKGEAGIAESVREAVQRRGISINTDLIEFPSVVTPKTNDEGKMFVEDQRGIVRYFLKTGEVEVTEEHTERHIVANNNQRALELHEMSSMR